MTDSTSTNVELHTAFLGMAMVACTEIGCGELTDEIEFGMAVIDVEGDEVEAVGVIRYSKCGHEWICACIVEMVADMTNSIENEQVIPILALATIDARSNLDIENDEDEPDEEHHHS